MLILISTSLMSSMSMFTLIMNTPITLGITILILALFTSITFSSLLSSWMAFLIFLIYISGTLIMFAYFVAMSPNMTMFTPLHIPLMIITPPTMLMFTKIMSNKITYQEMSYSLNTFYSWSSMPILMIMILILLYALVIVVKISSIYKGPLRPFMYV